MENNISVSSLSTSPHLRYQLASARQLTILLIHIHAWGRYAAQVVYGKDTCTCRGFILHAYVYLTKEKQTQSLISHIASACVSHTSMLNRYIYANVYSLGLSPYVVRIGRPPLGDP